MYTLPDAHPDMSSTLKAFFEVLVPGSGGAYFRALHAFSLVGQSWNFDSWSGFKYERGLMYVQAKALYTLATQ